MNYGTPSIMEVSEKEERKKGEKRWFKEITTENFPNRGTVIDIQVQEAQDPSNINLKKIAPNIIIKMLKVGDKQRIENYFPILNRGYVFFIYLR